MIRELVVISGKGGTGKTLLSSAFAAIDKKKIICDCDVDASNMHLMLHPKILKTFDFSGGKLAEIEKDKCISCGQCMRHCKFEAVMENKNTYKIDPILCEGCGVCSWVCKSGAVKFEEQKNGEYYLSETKHGKMLHAKLYAGEENSGKLVTEVRKKARKAAEDEGAHFIVSDGPPGIGCPVTSTLTGANYALIVSEPSLSAKHDMIRIYELCKHFKIRVFLCINKYDINLDISEEIESFCRNNNIEMLGKIPYDEACISAHVEGSIISVYKDSPAKNAIDGIIRLFLRKTESEVIS